MGYTKHRSDYLQSYYKGVGNLSAEARQDFENSVKDSKVTLQKDPDLLNEQFKTWILVNELATNSDPNIRLTALDSNKFNDIFSTTDKKDKAFAQLAMTKDLDGVSELVDNPVPTQKSAWWDVIKNAFSAAGADDGGPSFISDPLKEQAMEDLYEAHKNLSSVITKAASNSIRNQARADIQDKIKEHEDEVASGYRNMPLIDKGKFRKNIKDISQILSPDNFGYRLNGQATDSMLDDLAVQYMLLQEYGGDEMANEFISNYWKDYVANRQTTGEKFTNMSAQFANNAIGTIAMIAGVVGGLVGLNGSETDWSKGILDNPVTRWANNLISTGVYDSDEQARLKALGVNDDAILNTVQQDKELLHANTIYELVGQYGFTAASMLASFGASASIAKGTSWLVGKAAKESVKTAIKIGGRIAQMTVPFTVGIGEAGIEALTAKEESMRAGQGQIENYINRTIDDQITQFVENDPRAAEQLFLEYPELEQYWGTFGKYDGKKLKTSLEGPYGKTVEFPQKTYSDEEKQTMVALLQNHPGYRKKYEDNFEEYKKNALAQLQDSQENRMWTTFFANLAVTGSLNSTLQISQMAPGVRKAMPLRRNLHTRLVDFVMTNPNQWKALAKNFSITTLLKDNINRGIGEGLQEWGQAIIQAYDEGKAENYVTQYLQRSVNYGKPLDAFTEDVWMMIGAGLERAGQKALSKEAFKEGLYGTLSTILGGPTVNVNMNFGKRKAGESLVSSIARNMPITWGGMGDLVFAKSQLEAKNKAAQDQADAINAFFADEKNTNLFFNAVAGLDITRAYNLALDNEDERAARNSKLDLFFNAAAMVEALNGTDFHNAIMETLNERANLQESNLGKENSKEAAAIEEYRNNTGDTQSSDAEVIQQLKDSAQTLKDVIKQSKSETSKIRTIFGQNISLDAQNALVSNRLHIKDAEKRIKQLKEELDFVNYLNDDRMVGGFYSDHRSPHSEGIKRGYARYGTLSQVQQTREKLQEEIDRMEKQIASIPQLTEKATEQEKGFVRYFSNQLNRILEEKKQHKKNLNDYIQELKKLDPADAENIVLSALDIAELDSESRQALLSTKREHITVDKVQKDGSIKRKKILNPKNRVLSNQQWKAISQYRKRGKNEYDNFDSKVEDLYLLEKDLASYKATEEYFLKNTDDLLRISAYYKQEARKKLAAKKYEYLKEDDVAQSFKEFRDKVLETREKAESQEELDAIDEMAASNKKYGKQSEALDAQYEYLMRQIKRTEVFQKVSKEIQQDVLAIFDILNRHQIALDLKTSSSLVIGEELENIPTEEIEENWKRKTKQNYSMSNYGEAVITATQAFDQAKSNLKIESEINKPSHVDNVTPEGNTPQRSEEPIIEGPVIESSTKNPTVVASLDELVLKAATAPMKAFYEKHKVFDNIIRLVSQGKLTTYSQVNRQATQVFFTVERIGNSHEIIQLVEDSEGTYTINGKSYSVIGIETAATAFTSEEKSAKNIGKILERTASVVRVESKRKTGEATNLKDVEDSTTVLSNLTIGQRSNSEHQEKEMLYNTRTGRGGTVYTSSVSDTRIDQVVLSEGQTAIDILHSFAALNEEERAAVAYQYLKRLDYSRSNYMYKQITEALANQKWDSTDFSKTIDDINRALESFYVLGRFDGKAFTFSLERNGDEWQMSLTHPILPNNKYVVTKIMSPTQVDGQVIADMLLSTLAQASVNTAGNPNLLIDKPFLRFEIGLEDLKIIKDPLRDLALRKAKEGQMHRRIELGILQLPNNDSVLHPTKIQLAFNSDGKTDSSSQVIPTPNADSADSRSNTVETTDGTIVDGNTGIVVRDLVEEPKPTNIFEQASDEIGQEVVAPAETTEQEQEEVDPLEEEEEEEIPSGDIHSAMENDGEFGILYSQNDASKSTDKAKKSIRQTLNSIDVQKYLDQAEDPKLFKDMVDRILNYDEKMMYAILWHTAGLVREGEHDLSKKDANLYLDFLKEAMQTIWRQPWYISSAPIVFEETITVDEYKDLYNTYNTNAEHAKLFNLVYETAKQLSIEYRIGKPGSLFKGQEQEDNDIEALGYYSAYKGKFGFLKIMSSYLNSPFFSNQDKADTLLHELIHAVTAKAIRLVDGSITMPGVAPSKTLVSAVQQLTSIYNDLQQDGKLVGQYAMKNSKELIAELSNHDFLRELYKAQPLWKRLVDTIRLILSNMWEAVTGKKITIKSQTSKELRKILDTIMRESIKIGSLVGAKTTTQETEQQIKEAQRKRQVEALYASPNALSESWERLSDQAQEIFNKKGISKEVWEEMSSEERQKAIECI